MSIFDNHKATSSGKNKPAVDDRQVNLKVQLDSFIHRLTSWTAGITAMNRRRHYFLGVHRLITPQVCDVFRELQSICPKQVSQIIKPYLATLMSAFHLDGANVNEDAEKACFAISDLRIHTACLIDVLTKTLKNIRSINSV